MIHAPYHFVPLSNTIVFPEWGEQVSQDIPFRDHHDGELKITVEAKSDIFIREGSVGNPKAAGGIHDFCHDASGKYFIPGTSLKGMIRNVLEIATFGKLQTIANKRYAVRDLNSEEYRGKFMVNWNSVVHAGWLDISDEDNWRIFPCKYAEWSRPKEARSLGVKGDFGNRRQSAADKYVEFIKQNGSLSQKADLEHVHLNVKEQIPEHDEAHFPGHQVSGKLVFTGQPQDYVEGKKGKKYHEYFFYFDDRGNGEAVGDGEEERFGKSRCFFYVDQPEAGEVDENARHPNRDDFLFCHDAGQGQTSAKDWIDWKSKRLKEIREKWFDGMIPVFYVRDAAHEKLRFGLAKMFRFAGEVSVGEAARKSAKEHFPLSAEEFKPDMADLMFGYAKRWKSLRGRVQFGAAEAEGAVKPCEPREILLGSPRPSFYPAYLQQDDKGSGQIDKKKYKTWLSKDAKLRGWKRYPVLNDNVFERNEEQSEEMMTSFRPLPAGTKFHGTVRYHNLRKEELGALIWCLQFKVNKYYWHSLGMGKPYGYGKVKVSIDGPLSSKEQDDCRKCFVDYMTKRLVDLTKELPEEEQITNYEKSAQIKALLDMAANPETAERSWDFHYMSLDEYRQSKVNGDCLTGYSIRRKDAAPAPSAVPGPTTTNTGNAKLQDALLKGLNNGKVKKKDLFKQLQNLNLGNGEKLVDPLAQYLRRQFKINVYNKMMDKEVWDFLQSHS